MQAFPIFMSVIRDTSSQVDTFVHVLCNNKNVYSYAQSNFTKDRLFYAFAQKAIYNMSVAHDPKTNIRNVIYSNPNAR